MFPTDTAVDSLSGFSRVLVGYLKKRKPIHYLWYSSTFLKNDEFVFNIWSADEWVERQ